MNLNGDGGAESYEGVSIEWIVGHDPIMTIYDDGIEREAIDLTKINTIPEMHQMMVDKGFTKKKIDKEKKETSGKGAEDEATFTEKKVENEYSLGQNEKETNEKEAEEGSDYGLEKTLLHQTGEENKIFSKVAVEKGEVDYLRSELIRQERIDEARNQRYQLRYKDDKPMLEKNYFLLVAAILFAAFVMCRCKRRRRSRRHVV